MNKQPTKDQILTLLGAWVRQRPGLEFCNYGNVANYRSEVRRIGRQLDDARQLMRAVELASGMTAAQLAEGFRAFSGRLQITAHPKGWKLDYCAGQYWPTEYRAAACAVLAMALWDYRREDFTAGARKGECPGDAIRRKFREEFGRGIQSRWFY